VAFSPDGRWAASAAWDNLAEPGDSEVRIWDARTGTERIGFTVPQSQVISLAFSPGGDRLAVGCGAAAVPGQSALVLLWNLTSGAKYAQVAQHQGMVTAVAFSPDGHRVASVGKLDEKLCLIDATDGRLLHSATTIRSPTGMTFSPDGRRMAVIGYEGVVSLRDSNDGAEVFRIPGLVGTPESDIASDARVRFSPDGHWLVSTNWNGDLNLWDGRPRDQLPTVVADPGP
jgi:WD40 repeat protein